MSAAPWPCWKCRSKGVRNIGARGYCARHLVDLFGTFSIVAGIGIPIGEGGHLECSRCEATWVGTAHEACAYCVRHLELLREVQASRTLEVPDVDPDDPRAEDMLRAWAGRMQVAVEAGIVTDHQADTAWRGAVIRHGAAA